MGKKDKNTEQSRSIWLEYLVFKLDFFKKSYFAAYGSGLAPTFFCCLAGSVFTPLGARPVFTPLGGSSICAALRVQYLRRLGASPVFTLLGARPVFTPLGREPSVYAAWRASSVYATWRASSVYAAWRIQYLHRLAGSVFTPPSVRSSPNIAN